MAVPALIRIKMGIGTVYTSALRSMKYFFCRSGSGPELAK